MRLITLEFEGIGSFADQMTIDFEALGSAGLFLVEGPTGSGKSTILDAIVFALYGSTAGANSDLGRLDSHVRSRSSAPYVQLVFEVGGGRYQIRRSPRHQRDKRRGSGTTDDNGSVSLVQLAPHVRDLSHKAREIGDWVIEHIGLTKSQFAATIVLAQGEFASFLDANTEARAQILEKVFGTEFYKDVEDQLACMRRAALKDRQRAQDAVQETLHRCLGALGLDPGQDEVQRIDGELLALREALLEAQQRSAETDRSHAAAVEALRAAQVLSRAQTRKRELLERQADLSAQRQDVLAQKQAIADHERAVPISPAKAAWDTASERVDQAQVRLDAAKARLAALGVTKACREDVELHARTIGALQSALEAEREVPSLQMAADNAQRLAAEAADVVTRLEAEHAALLTTLTSARDTLEALVEPAGELSELLLTQDQAQTGLATWAGLDRAELELAEAAQRRAAHQDVYDRALAQLTDATRERDQDLAARLAEHLREGQPCLVCGSCEHPDPARFGAAPHESELKTLAQHAEQAHDRLRALDETVARCEGVVQTLRASVTQPRAQLQEQLDGVRAQITAQRAAEAAFVAARRELDERRDDMDAVTARLGQARICAQRELTASAQAASALSAARDLVERSRGDHDRVADHLAALQAQMDAIGDVLTCTSSHEHAMEEAAGAQRLLRETLDVVGFDDAEQACAALLSSHALERARLRVTDYERACSELETALGEVDAIDLEAVVDLQALQDEVDIQRMHLHEANQAKGSIEYRLCEATPLREHLATGVRDLEEVRHRTDSVIRMADFATANRSEVVHRVKLSSFVLMRRFQSVVDAANDRLDAISEGRYQLAVETRGLDNRGLAGLDLLVADQHTEQTRSTRSLSGGERFYVALALALGLADVVRSESGGVQLGTLFIDEGFGSLDPETLEEVIDMLEQVRAGQDRVIGLVSHVDLLKQRIDARISVRRDPHRSAVSTVEVHT